MISKELLRSKIEQHCKRNKIDNFIKACIIIIYTTNQNINHNT